MTAAFIINPHSGAGGKRGRRLADEVARRGSVAAEMLGNFDDLAGILSDFAARRITTLFISGGDGTVQAIQTLLAENGVFERPPTLALLPHGTTNMTASTLGCRLGDSRKIADLSENAAALARPETVRRRHTVRVVNPAGRGPLHGMFVGAGSIRGAVEFTQSTMNGTGIRGELAPLATLLALLGRHLFSRRATGIVRAYPMKVSCDGQSVAEGELLLFLASTLKKLVLRCRPYWAPGASELKALTIAYPPPNVLRNILPLMYGVPNRNLPDECQSRAARSIEVAGQRSFVVDGECFSAPTDEPLKMELGASFAYLCP